MLQVIDLIETQNAAAAQAVWQEVCNFLAAQPGFMGGQLLETVSSLHPQGDYQYTSVCYWQDDAQWQRARMAAKDDAHLKRVLALTNVKFHGFKGVQVDGTGYDIDTGIDDHMVLVDVIALAPERMDGYAAMWTHALRYMESKDGYVGATLHRTVEVDKAVKFINIAEWRSTEQFFAALNTPMFLAIIDDYKQDFALYLSRKCRSVRPAPQRQPEEMAA